MAVNFSFSSNFEYVIETKQCGYLACSAKLHVLDGIYTRMGASDSIQHGSSTFFEELSETSHILRHCTSHSLVIIDELGRGTSTHDGVAIAYATLHYLLHQKKCLILFVTHYPQILDIQNKFEGSVGAYHVSYLTMQKPLSLLESRSESDVECVDKQEVTFLYKVVHGASDKSFGLNVARLAQNKIEERKEKINESTMEIGDLFLIFLIMSYRAVLFIAFFIRFLDYSASTIAALLSFSLFDSNREVLGSAQQRNSSPYLFVFDVGALCGARAVVVHLSFLLILSICKCEPYTLVYNTKGELLPEAFIDCPVQTLWARRKN
ncbi:DNA mismatch repair protein MSH3 [Platanthera guangdongensis]|uniref:DNA mismatch repair protein MSH3 n=1 Tax=Platanthera guangdongensis TaxID=2320717 RepID=A0ABR2MPL5_9ASPA